MSLMEYPVYNEASHVDLSSFRITLVPDTFKV